MNEHDTDCKNIIVISDTHCGCQLGLINASGTTLDGGGEYTPSALQIKLWKYWREFWDKWVPDVTRGEPFILVNNGDSIDGVHHGSKSQASQNLTIQKRIARQVLRPEVEKATKYYHIRGTEAHVGKSAEEEEDLAETLGATPDARGNHARYDLWLRFGGHLVNFMHHVGTTSSAAYEATAVYKELVEMFNEAARWGDEPPAIVVRSHRHRCIEIRVPNQHGEGIVFVTPCWQLKTPFAWKIAGARISTPQIGGSIIRLSDEGEVYVRHYIRTIGRSKEECV